MLNLNSELFRNARVSSLSLVTISSIESSLRLDAGAESHNTICVLIVINQEVLFITNIDQKFNRTLFCN